MGSKQSSVKQQNNQTSSLQQQPNKNQINQQQQPNKNQINQQQQRKQQTNQRVTTQGKQLRNKQVITQGQQLRNKQVITQGQQLRNKQVITQGQQQRNKQVTTQGKQQTNQQKQRKNQINQQGKQETNQQKQRKNQINQQGKQQTNQQKQRKNQINQQGKQQSNQKSSSNMFMKNFRKGLARHQQNVSSTSITPQKTQTQQQRQNNENQLKQNMFNRIKDFICNSTNPVVKNRICNSASFPQNMQLTGLENILRNFQNLQLRPSHGMGIFSNIDLKAGDEIIIDFNTIAYNSSNDTDIKKAIKFYSGDEYTKTHALSQNSLFPITGLLNYSDNPNCLLSFLPCGFSQNENKSYEVSITHCIKNIERGEELTVPYQTGFAILVDGVINYYFLDDINFNNDNKIKEKLTHIDEQLLKRMTPSHYNFIDNTCFNQLFLYLCKNLIMKIGHNNFSKDQIINKILSYDNVYLGIQSMAFLQKLIEIYGAPSSSTSSTGLPFRSGSNLDRIYSLYDDPQLQKFKTLMRPSVFNFPDFPRNLIYLMKYIQTTQK